MKKYRQKDNSEQNKNSELFFIDRFTLEVQHLKSP